MAKSNRKTISDLIGPTKVDHHAYLVRTGLLNEAVRFFVEEFHWVEYRAPAKGDWGTARFVRQPNTTSVIQLSEYLSRPVDLLDCSDDQHLAIAVMIVSAEEAAGAICNWAIDNDLDQGLSNERANADGSKWFVHIPALFTFALEIVKVEAFRTS